jgi:hypothetical protein
MGFAVQLYCVRFHYLSLHVSAYMAIFKCVRYFIFICMKDSTSLFFLPFIRVVTLCTFPSVGWDKYEVLLFAVYAIVVLPRRA